MHDLRPMTAAEIAQERENLLQRQALGPGERARQVQVEHAWLTFEKNEAASSEATTAMVYKMEFGKARWKTLAHIMQDN